MYVHLAGHASHHQAPLLNSGKQNPFLWSYWVIRKGKKLTPLLKREAATRPLMIDSGTFSFIGRMTKHGERLSLKDAEVFTEEYATWLQENASWVKCAVECDFHDIVGYDPVMNWREKYFFPLQKLGVTIVFVWRDKGTLAHAKQLLDDDRVKYTAFGGAGVPGGHSNSLLVKRRRAFALEANRKGKAVHGFAQVNTKLVETIPYASVDSTSWSSMSRFGTSSFYTPQKGLTQISKGALRGKVAGTGGVAAARRLAAEKGAAVHLYGDEIGNRTEIMCRAIDSYGRMRGRTTALWRRRGLTWAPVLEEIYGDTFVPEDTEHVKQEVGT
jgi:hypothetical protein